MKDEHRDKHDPLAPSKSPDRDDTGGQAAHEQGRAQGQGAPPPPADEDLSKVRAERDDYLARLQRVSADYMNYQKRLHREIAESGDYATGVLVKDLLPVIDDMDRALASARKSPVGAEALLAGLELVHDKALEVLSRHGVTRIESQGQGFDPDRHRAVQQVPAGDAKPGTVVAELQPGYQMKGRILRPASVVVAAEPKDAPADAEDED